MLAAPETSEPGAKGLGGPQRKRPADEKYPIGSVCLVTVTILLGSVPSLLDKFAALYVPLSPGRKLGLQWSRSLYYPWLEKSIKTNSFLNKHRRVLSTTSCGDGASTCERVLCAMRKLRSESLTRSWNLKNGICSERDFPGNDRGAKGDSAWLRISIYPPATKPQVANGLPGARQFLSILGGEEETMSGR